MHTGIFISVPVASHISHKVIFQPCVNSVAWHGKGFHGCIQNTPMLQLCVLGVCVCMWVGLLASQWLGEYLWAVQMGEGGGSLSNCQFYQGGGLFPCVIFQFSTVTRVWVVHHMSCAPLYKKAGVMIPCPDIGLSVNQSFFLTLQKPMESTPMRWTRQLVLDMISVTLNLFSHFIKNESENKCKLIKFI